MVYVPAPFALSAIFDALDAELELLVNTSLPSFVFYFFSIHMNRTTFLIAA